MSAQPRPLRRLNRAQIQEILERNISLYREEENFAPYIVDLALYLLEYEYDWADGGIDPPMHLASARISRATRASESNATPSPEPLHHTPYPGVNSSALTPPRSPGVTTPGYGGTRNGNGSSMLGERKIISPQLRPREATPAGGLGRVASNPSIAISCPHCGTPVGKESVCPSCRNMVR